MSARNLHDSRPGHEPPQGSDPGDALRAAVALAEAAGIVPVGKPEPLGGGRNNRVYRLHGRERDVLIKLFYRGPAFGGGPDRFAAEVAFSRFAWTLQPAAVAEPLGADETHGVALFSYVEGRSLLPQNVRDADVEAALAFVVALNGRRDEPPALALPIASEAAFSLATHLDVVASRVARLTAIEASDAIDTAAIRFVGQRLRPVWRTLSERIRGAARAHGIDPARTLDLGERCLSPSDFGFHNALRTASGGLVFHDFEYAGWDDPAKLVADFFLQPQVPVDRCHRDRFADTLVEALALGEAARVRIDLLDPIFRVKWCCIVLNEFLADARARRRFAGDATDRRRDQLAKAEALLQDLEEAQSP